MLGFGVLVISGMLASVVVLGVWFSLCVPVADFGCYAVFLVYALGFWCC